MPLRPIALLFCRNPRRPDLSFSDRHGLNSYLAPDADVLGELIGKGAFEDTDEIALAMASQADPGLLRTSLARRLPHRDSTRRVVVDLMTGQMFTDHLTLGKAHDFVPVGFLADRYRETDAPLPAGATLRLVCAGPEAPDLLKACLAEVLHVDLDGAQRYLTCPDGVAVSLTDVNRLVLQAAKTCAEIRRQGGPDYTVGTLLGTLRVAPAAHD